MIDYDKIAEKYDLTRGANIETLKMFASELPLDGKNVLDFGCGTGNFTYALRELTGANLFGAEPSDNMREKALAKGNIDVRKGDHSAVPFDDAFFDFIYMTDVIHHVPDIDIMFRELSRVLKPSGLICILTESHEQLATRFWVNYFPATVAAERARYPDIPVIIESAERAGFAEYKTVTTENPELRQITSEFVTLVENKGYSMFNLISDSDYNNGLKKLKEDYAAGVTFLNNHGETLLWLKKM